MHASVGLYPSSGRGGVLGVIAILAGLALLALGTARGCDGEAVEAARTFALGCGATIALALLLLSRRVVADDRGVRRHDLTGTRSVEWGAVHGASFEEASSRRRARITLSTAQGALVVPADPRLAQVIRARLPGLAPSLAAIPAPDAAARAEAARGLELWLVAVQGAGAAVIASSLLPTLDARLIAGAAVILLAASWVLAVRRGPVLLRGLTSAWRETPPGWLRLAAAGGENAVALVLLTLVVNVIIGAAGRAAVPSTPPRIAVLAGVDVPVQTVAVAGRDLAVPASLAPACEVRETGLVCTFPDGWIAVDRDEGEEGLLGGDMLRRTALFRRDDLRLDGLPHHSIAWYAAGMLARMLERDPPDAVVERADGEASFFWRRGDRVRALVASGGEMLSVDVKGAAVRDATLLPLLGSIRASGSDLRCRWASALARVAGGAR